MGDKCEICNGSGFRAAGFPLIGCAPCGFCNGTGAIGPLAEAIADVIRPKMTKPRFIAHTGKKQPVDDHLALEVMFPDSTTTFGFSERFRWSKTGKCSDIIAYRVIEQEG